MGFLSVCGMTSMRQGLWEKAQEFLWKIFNDIGQLLTSSRAIGNPEAHRASFLFTFDPFSTIFLPKHASNAYYTKGRLGWTHSASLSVLAQMPVADDKQHDQDSWFSDHSELSRTGCIQAG